MKSQRLIRLVVHPFFIGSLITALIAILAMPEINRYKVTVVEKRYIASTSHRYYFADMDGDQNSEEIQVDHTPEMLKIMIRKDGGILDQYNLRSKALHNDYLRVGDHNLDGFKEIYLLTADTDSLYISILDPFIKQDFILKERPFYFNDSISFADEIPTAFLLELVPYAEGHELIFAISSGFKRQPRGVFKYNIINDELKVSPLMGVALHNPITEDINNDSLPEILFPTTAVGNYSSYIPYTDQSAWLMALNKDLEFLFEPVEIPKYPTNLHVTTIRNTDSVFIVGLNEYFGADSIQTGLHLFDHQGKQLQFSPLEKIQRNNYYLSSGVRKGKPVIYVLNGLHGIVRAFDEKLEETGLRKIPPVYIRMGRKKTDIDQDGREEYLFNGEQPGSFVIFREHFRHPLVVDLGESSYSWGFTPFKREGIQYLYTRFSNAGYILEYGPNPLFYVKYPLVVLIFLSSSLLISLIYRLQKYRAERDYQAKRKMNELQILSLKNQIDPHFTFNILNSIGSLYTLNNDPKMAYDIFVKYSNLLRNTIKNSDKISISIAEELDFVNTYVELEQFRNSQAFKYQVEIADDTDLSIHIPRLLIHTFVENAIKHGARLAGENALLELSISRNKHAHHIRIRDNGPGLGNNTENRPAGTGSGIKIIEEMIHLFHQLEGIRISYRLDDLSALFPESQGAQAIITIG